MCVGGATGYTDYPTLADRTVGTAGPGRPKSP